MILLDTNVLSELLRPEPRLAVRRWLDGRPLASVFVSAVTEAELRFGIALLPPGKRRSSLAEDVEAMLEGDFGGRMLPFDRQAAVEFADILASRRKAGRPMPVMDAQIAAIARSRGASLATRNVTDFQGCGLVVVDPWSSH